MAAAKHLYRKWEESREDQDNAIADERSPSPDHQDVDLEAREMSFINNSALEHELLLDEDADQEDWSDISVYFADNEWRTMPAVERAKYRTMKERYEHMMQNSVPVKPPYFMVPAAVAQPTQRRPQTPRSVGTVEIRASPRNVTKRNYSEISPNKTPPRVRLSAQSNVPENSNEEMPNPPRSSNNTPTPPASTAASTERASAPSTSSGRSRGGRIPEKIRTLDEKVFGIPSFGGKSLTELSKRRINMNMRPIYHDCKDYIRRKSRGREYLDREEWTNFAREVCDAYPNLKTEEENYWESFKVGLQKSFSAERKNNKKKEAIESTQETLENSEDSPSIMHPLDLEAQDATRELKNNCDRRAIKELLEKSHRFRKEERSSRTPSELLLEYPYLKVPEMMVYDYLITIGITVEECEKTFSDNATLLGAHFGISTDSESDILEIMIKVHEFFLSKAVKKGLKAVFIVKEEERQSLSAMESSNIQAPFIVVLKKLNFVTGVTEIRSASLLMANNLVSSLQKPSVDKIMLFLLAAYVTLNAEYPSPYQQFMRALEKLVTGKAQPSKFGRTQVQYDRLMSLIKKKN